MMTISPSPYRLTDQIVENMQKDIQAWALGILVLLIATTLGLWFDPTAWGKITLALLIGSCLAQRLNPEKEWRLRDDREWRNLALKDDLFHRDRYGHPQKARAALSFGVHILEVDFVPDCKSYPLHIAALREGPERVRTLLDRGAKVDGRTKFGCTALLYAIAEQVSWQREANVKLLLERNANVNAQDRYGRTALMLAAAWGDSSTVRILLEHDADTTLVNKSGQTAEDLAADAVKPILTSIREHGELRKVCGLDENTEETSEQLPRKARRM